MKQEYISELALNPLPASSQPVGQDPSHADRDTARCSLRTRSARIEPNESGGSLRVDKRNA